VAFTIEREPNEDVFLQTPYVASRNVISVTVQRPSVSPIAELYLIVIPPMSMQQITLAQSTGLIQFIRVSGKRGSCLPTAHRSTTSLEAPGQSSQWR
jgi:hypothetical protein